MMIKPFVPQLVYIEPGAMEYPLGVQLKEKFEKMGIEIRQTTSHNQVRNIPGKNDLQKYRNAKSTLVVGVRKTLKFDTSKPSAEYAIPFATGCMGHCHYCYLQTTMGSKPYIRTYVNVEEILGQAEQYMQERAPQITRFEAACTSDIVGIDHLTHSLKRAIEYFGESELGQLRFVTKFHHVDHLLDAKHNGRTRFRFSINADYVIKTLNLVHLLLITGLKLLIKLQKPDIHLALLWRLFTSMKVGKRDTVSCLKSLMLLYLKSQEMILHLK